MKTENTETIFQGWLVKSPPRKKFEKIWKLKWRRRWFALKRGEIPGQFFLQYYTDSDCHKLKGQIDLDQCEQVDAGLRMLDKFQHMFDIKTPQRIYYLAAATEEDMRSWVKWICEVCGLQESSGPNVQYLNIGADASLESPIQTHASMSSIATNATTRTGITVLNQNFQEPLVSPSISLYSNMYQNSSFGDSLYRASGVNDYSNRETILISEAAHKMSPLNNNNNNNNSINQFDRSIAESYTNFSTIERASIERSHSLKAKTGGVSPGTSSHSRTQSLDEQGAILKQQRKLPANLRLNSFTDGDKKPSPALSSSSGPYIPISECFSGGAYRVDNGNKQNLSNSIQYSPKSQGQNASDSESVFTDDEWTHPVLPHNTLTRNKLQSETSLDNDPAAAWTYVQRFSKVLGGVPPPRPPKRTSGIYSANSSETGINNKESPLSSPSAIMGPHRNPHNNNNNQQQQSNLFDNGLPTPGFSPLDAMNVIASSTPNLIHETQHGHDGARTLPHSRQNSYTNAMTPSKVEGYIFRYDFSDQGAAPVVNRKLKPGTKPKTISESSVMSQPRIKGQNFYTLDTPPKKNGPQVDRKLKPPTPKSGLDIIRRINGPSSSMNITLPDEHTLNNMHDDSLLLNNKSGIKFPEDRLQYLDLDHSNTPVTPKKSMPVKRGGPQGATSTGNLLSSARGGENLSSVAYTTVDFVKTDAFNRIREESSKQRMKK